MSFEIKGSEGFVLKDNASPKQALEYLSEMVNGESLTFKKTSTTKYETSKREK